MVNKIVPVILSGGSGSRLWPKSRKAYPKQLHTLYGDKTMLQHTALRVASLGAPIVVCNDDQRFMVADQLSQVCATKPDIILEPVARNTAPAIAAAATLALQLYEKDVDEVILVVLAADHLIRKTHAFEAALEKAIIQAQKGHFVTFGVVPTCAETGYGYIKTSTIAGPEGAAVEQFVEKPTQERARAYLEAGTYTWNSGMFVLPAAMLLEELRKCDTPWLAQSEKAVIDAKSDLDFVRLNEAAFAQCDDISIDFALMEKTNKAWMVPLDAGWSDLGSWDSLWATSEKDEQGNATLGDVLIKDSKNCLVQSEDRLIAAVGLDNVVIVDSDDAVLVVDKSSTQDVKKIVDELKRSSREEYKNHRKVHRPWGSYASLAYGERYQVKCIKVKPGASLSLQMHHHRAEHWVVVSGTALVQRGDDELLLTENESVYIPLGEKHRLTNPGKLMLELIEVQSGSYLGEDDIVRFEDVFGRAN